MEDNKVILLALLILVVSSFNVNSITGNAANHLVLRDSVVYESSFGFYTIPNMGDINNNGIFNLDDCKILERNYQESQGHWGRRSYYYDVKADFDPMPRYYQGSFGDGDIDESDTVLCRAWTRRLSAVAEGGAFESSNIKFADDGRQCYEGDISASVTGWRSCVNGIWKENKCPGGYEVIVKSDGKVNCVLSTLQPSDISTLGIQSAY